jgi:hypothetical protein
MTEERKKTGPPAATVKIDKPWEEAVADALKKKRPPEGWPGEKKSKPKKKKPA